MADEKLNNVQQLEVNRAVEKFKKEYEAGLVTYKKLADLTGFQEEMIAVMHKSIAKDTTPNELAYFLSVCKGVGLNPLNKEIWCYKDSQKNVIIFTGRDGFLKKNKENPLYRGMKSSEVCEFDEFEIDMIEGTVVHKISNNRGKPIGAYAIVYVEGQKDVIVYLDFEEFDLKQAKWKTAPKMMIKKCAQSHALKEAAGITGIQAEESFHVKNGVASAERTDDIPHEEVNPEKERLLILIKAAKNIEALEKLKQYCNDAETVLAYDEKKKEF